MRLPDDLERAWIAQVAQLETERNMQYVTSVERFALQKGREEGREEGTTRLLLRLIDHRFGEIPEGMTQRISHLSLAQAEALVDALLGSESLAQFLEQLPPLSEV